MNIVVCVKQVPDTWSEKKLDPSDSTLDRGATDPVMNEMDEYAVEEALQLQEAQGGEVTILCMGPDSAAETVRKALSMGADKAIHVLDPGLHGSDAVATSLALARAVEKAGESGQVDLVLLGSESSDARMSVVPAMLAERLGLPQLTFAKEVTVDGGTVRIKRLTDEGYQAVEATLPAVVSVVEKINEPRYPSFKGIMAAKKKPVETYGLADLGIDAGDVGLGGAWSAVESFESAPPREAGTVVKDEGGDGADKLLEFLTSKKFV
ncbi:MAG TPA: electron transfer flavoprotein subunit beta/FixA family protein [Actinomycetes bacterium]|nr:electron transfer flavoprotein subunit beta/FixA family protein [Actinomycetes bacterium]